MQKENNRVFHALKVFLLPLIIYAVLILLSVVLGRKFGTPKQLFNILQMSVRPYLIACGMFVIMKAGRWDFSGGAQVLLVAMAGGWIMNKLDLPPIVFVLISIIMGLLIGLINGTLYLLLRLPGLVLSLGLVMVYEVMTLPIRSIRIPGEKCTFGAPPWMFVYVFVIWFVFHIVYNKTVFGYHLKAMGNGQAVARDVGVNIKRTTVLSFVLSSVFFALAGVVYLSVSSAQESVLNMGTGLLIFNAMMSCLVAMQLSRYADITIALFIAAFCMSMITTGLISLGIPAEMQNIVQGLFILAFIYITSNQGRLEKRHEINERVRMLMAQSSKTG